MSAVLTPYFHIYTDDNGVPFTEGTNMKVIELVLEHLAHGWSPDELQYQHPYLTMGQIHSALAYYWDHQQELDEDMARRAEYEDALRDNAAPNPLVEWLKAYPKILTSR